MVGPGRLELPTPRLSSVCSNQLSYGPLNRSASPANKPEQARFGINPFKRKRNVNGGVRHKRKTSEDIKAFRLATALTGPSCSKKHGKVHTVRRQSSYQFHSFLRKEVIQPQVPLRLPCYDFTPVADPTVVACLLAVSAAPSGKTNSHGVTGGVYKARERIHRGVLIHDY